MTNEEFENWESLEYRMDAEGFDYCFDGYSNWGEIKDEKFHELRKNYLKSMNELRFYITMRIENERENR